jgi:tetratricopeptide (TPR) repeat protein
VGKLKKALKDVKKAIRLKEDYDVAYVTKGEILLEMDKTEEAEKAFDKAVELGFDREKIDEILEEDK